MDNHTNQGIIVIVEDYVPPATIESELEQAGLVTQAAILEPNSALPILGTLIKDGHRLVMFAEEQGGTPPGTCPPSPTSRTRRSAPDGRTSSVATAIEAAPPVRS